MKLWLMLIIALTGVWSTPLPLPAAETLSSEPKKVYVVPIREDIMPPLVYVVRRGVKEAMENNADLLVLDMDTNGGRVDSMLKIIEIIEKFQGQTVTYVNTKAFSAGALMSFATQKIFMAPQSVIGAAAPVMMSPGGSGAESMSDTMEVKTASGLSALMRTHAEKNHHNTALVDAMVKKTSELIIDGVTINQKGEILTLTNTEAEKEYGAKLLLSSGSVDSLDLLLERLGYADAQRVNVKPTGAEKLGFWINMISPLLLIIGIVGLYIEFKTPGFGLPGIIGITALAIYFLGGYVAGLSGMEWLLVFFIGIILVALELFVFPGTLVLGLSGAALMLIALVMALVDAYPAAPDAPRLPGLPGFPEFKAEDLYRSLQNVLIAFVGSAIAAWVLSRYLPKTSLFQAMFSRAASGVVSVARLEQQQASRLGQVGETISPLRPGGKARFGEQVLDVMSQGDLIPRGQKVRIIRHSGTEAVVEVVNEA